jgi:hypothetical protein
MNSQKQTLKAESVFLQSEQRLELESLFGPHSMDAQTHAGLTLSLEISLYALFASFITVMTLLPNQASNIQAMFPSTVLADPIGFILWIKMALFVASLVPLFWALHLSSKRLKGRLFARRLLRSKN